MLVVEGRLRGLHLSLTKSLVTWAGEEVVEDPLGKGVPRLEAGVGGFKLLHALLGSRLFERSILNKRVGGDQAPP